MRVFFRVIGILIIVIISIFFLYRMIVLNNLRDLKRVADVKWSELYETSNNRKELLSKLITGANNRDKQNNGLKIIIDNNNKDRLIHKNECSLDFVKIEYLLNKEYMIFLNNYTIDSSLISTNNYKIIQQLKENEYKINGIITEYNRVTREYNKYISIFPNFIFAKKNGFSTKKFFTIKYGKENEDPVEKSKKLPEWAKGVDTL